MLIRLWWKEWRTLVPIIATLVLAATTLQWFLLNSGGSGVRNGILIPIALSWAVLYAIAAGSASFAGERENRTLGLLDALPVGRGKLWFAKGTWAIGSSLVLALVLRWIASLGWRYELGPFAPVTQIDTFFAVLIVEAAVWGLLWSALTQKAITASILAVVSTGIMSSLTGWLQRLDSTGLYFGGLDQSSMIWRGGGMIGALAVSWLVLSREFWPRRKFRSAVPITTPARSDRALLSWAGSFLWPTPAFGSIGWQTIREGWVVWFQCLGLLVLASLLPGDLSLGIVPLTLVSLALVILGASVFGIEQSTGTRAFLDHYAVRPRTVWIAKMTPWMVGLAVFAAIGWPLFAAARTSSNLPREPVLWLLGNMFAVALLGGMIFARRITAALISIMVSLALIVPQAALIGAQQLPTWILAVPPLIMVGASWFWAGDWLAGRGLRRWSKLAALVLVPFATLVATFMASRAWGVADPGRQSGSASFSASSPADLSGSYRTVIGTIQMSEIIAGDEPHSVGSHGRTAEEAHLAEYFMKNKDAVTALSRLAAGPGLVVATDSPATIFLQPKTSNLTLAQTHSVPLLVREARRLMAEADLAGAWQNIETLFQMSIQYATGARSVAEYEAAIDWSARAMALAADWARHPRITIELIRSARGRLGNLAGPPRMDDVFRFESQRVEQSLDHPGDRWADLLHPLTLTSEPDPGQRILDSWILAPAWERERARRVLRRVAAEVIHQATEDQQPIPALPVLVKIALEGSSSPPAIGPDYQPLDFAHHPDLTLIARLMPPFIRGLSPYGRAVLDRRLLDAFLALRAWQLAHNGYAPESLEELIPSELEQLPENPFGSRLPIQYGRVPGLDDGIQLIDVPIDSKAEFSRLDPGTGRRINSGGNYLFTDEKPVKSGTYRIWAVGLNQQLDARGQLSQSRQETDLTLLPNPPLLRPAPPRVPASPPNSQLQNSISPQQPASATDAPLVIPKPPEPPAAAPNTPSTDPTPPQPPARR